MMFAMDPEEVETSFQATMDRFWWDMPLELKRRGHEILAREEPQLLEFVRRNPDSWHDLLSEDIDLGNGQVIEYPFHMSGGMHVRNVLRVGSPARRASGILGALRKEPAIDGIKDDELPSGEWYYGESSPNWDDYYTRMIEYAAGVRQ